MPKAEPARDNAKLRISNFTIPVSAAEVSSYGLQVEAMSPARWVGVVATAKQVWLDRSLDDEWSASYRVVADERRRPVVAEVRIYPTASAIRGMRLTQADIPGVTPAVPRGGLKARTCRKLKVGEDLHLQQLIMARIAHDKNGLLPLLAALGIDANTGSRAARSTAGRPATLSSQDYRRLLSRARALSGTGKVLQTLSTEFGLSIAAVKTRLNRARALEARKLTAC